MHAYHELSQKIAVFKNLFILQPTITGSGIFIPADFSRGVFGDPTLLSRTAHVLTEKINWQEIDCIAGIELQGVALATALSLQSGKPLVIVREKPKRVGRSAIVGDINFLKPGRRVLLVDDLLAFGMTKQTRAHILEERGVDIRGLAVFFDMEYPPQKGAGEQDIHEWLRHKNVSLYSLFTWGELVHLQVDAGTIPSELAGLLLALLDTENFVDPKRGYLAKAAVWYERNHIFLPEEIREYFKMRGIAI